MKAMVCDRCGKVFTENTMETIYIKTNFGGPILDLCDDCLRRILLFLKEPESEVCVPITTAMLTDKGVRVVDGYGVVIPNESVK